MLDASDTAKGQHRAAAGGPPRDFQEHLRLLDEKGLLTRIDRPIDKDRELHPLVRWQFQGGLAEDQRRAFLFTNVVDSAGRRYDIPVAVGAFAASPEIYAARHGQAGRGYRRGLDPGRREADPARDCHIRRLSGGRDQRRGSAAAGRGSGAAAGADIDAGLRLRPLSHRDACASPATPKPACKIWGPIAAR